MVKKVIRKTFLLRMIPNIRYVSRDLLLIPSGVDTHTRKHTNVRTKTISRNQARAAKERASGLKRGIGIESEKFMETG